MANKPQKSILVGDLNIAPREDDVWYHKKLLKVVSHTPVEVEHLAETQDAGAWVDITRQDIPEGQLYSWWSYRARDWDAADKGRRLDHVWATPDIANAGHSSRVLRDGARMGKAQRPCPGVCEFRSGLTEALTAVVGKLGGSLHRHLRPLQHSGCCAM